MRMRSRTRRVRPPMQWLTGTGNAWAPATGNNIAAATLTSTILIDATSGGLLGVPQIARMTVHRIRGQLGFQMQGAAQGVISCGIIVKESSTGGSYNPDPSLAADADAGWMWLHHFGGVPVAASTTRTYMNYDSVDTVVDVKVKRIIRPNEVMSLVMICPAAFTVFASLRSLISRVA